MKILLIVGQNLCAYQKHIVHELQELPQLAISLLINPHNSSEIPRDNRLKQTLNAKFPLYQTSPYASEDTVDFMDHNPELKSFQRTLYYDYVINCCVETVINDFNIKFGNIVKPLLDVKSWFGACITGKQNTTLRLLHSTDNKNYSLHPHTLSFTTEMGTYNNRNKALFYFSYLFKSLFNGNKYGESSAEQNKYSLWQDCLYQGKLFFHILKRKFSTRELNWKIAVLEGNSPRILIQERCAFWADPFIVKEKNHAWIFFEELDKKSGLGRIAVVDLQGQEISEKRTVLEQPYHLSFPNVFQHGGDYFMLPEESASGAQHIYRATAFPYQWEKFRTLLPDIKAVDSVFIFYKNKYWLFFNKIESFEYENNERLYLYFSDDLFSDQWISHPQNPVIIDKSKARNAGKIVEEDGAFVRVAQNCIEHYGAGVSKNRIEVLTELVYREESLHSSWDFNTFQGFHTVNTDGDITVIDLLLKGKNSNSLL